MSATRLRRVAAALLMAVAFATIALLPVTVPTADDTNPPTPSPAADGAENPGRPVGPLYGGKTAEQQFPAGGTGIRSVAFAPGTYRRTNRGVARVTIQAMHDGKWQELATRAIDKQALKDNIFYSIAFSPPLAVAAGQPIRILLQSDGEMGDAIAWWSNTRWQPDGYLLSLDGMPQDGTALFRVSYAPATGRLFQLLGPIWERATVFLDPFWRIVLVVGLGLLAGGLVLIGLRLFAA